MNKKYEYVRPRVSTYSLAPLRLLSSASYPSTIGGSFGDIPDGDGASFEGIPESEDGF